MVAHVTQSSDNKLPGVPNIPHAALLIGGSLLILGGPALLLTRAGRLIVGGQVLLTVAAGMSLVLGLALLTGRRFRSIAGCLLGLLLLDLLPVALELTGAEPVRARYQVVCLVVPTVIAAATLPRWLHRLQMVAAVGISAAMIIVPGAESQLLESVVMACVAVGSLLVAGVVIRRMSQATAARIADLRRLSMTDGLTGVLNRRGLASRFPDLVRAARHDAEIGLLILDIDHFKQVNDEYGHAAGDAILQQVCAALADVVGPADLVARVGGEELAAAVVGPAEPVAEAFRERLIKVRPSVTASIGIVDAGPEDCAATGRLWQLLDVADRALYEAKNTGRDRICHGVADDAERAEPQREPRQISAAAVALEPSTPGREQSRLYGWVLLVFSMLGLIQALTAGPTPLSTLTNWLFLAGAGVAMVTALLVIGLSPLLQSCTLLTGALGADLITAISVLTDDGAVTRRVMLIALLIPALLVSLHVRRSVILAHYAVIGGVCALAVRSTTGWSAISGAILCAAVLAGSAELIYLLRRRHDIAAEDLHRWSVTDPLTGLANRRGLELAFGRMPRAKDVVVLALDVDDFKAVNDRHGHAVGDDALIRLAATLTAVAGPGTVVGRTGGDEFVLLSPSGHPSTLTSRVRRAAGLLPVPLSLSVGSTTVPSYSRLRLWQLVSAADADLTRDKRGRRATGRPGDKPPDVASALRIVRASDDPAGTSAARPATTRPAAEPLVAEPLVAMGAWYGIDS